MTRELAQRGAQIVLLTRQPLIDPFLADFIMDMRNTTGNEMINAEYVDLEDLHSIRKFATKWVDNAPPRRLDMIILCANSMTPSGKKRTLTEDGIESDWGVNYVANFHMLSILSPALKAQPADRDVRILVGTCASYMGGAYPVPSLEPGKINNKAKTKNKEADTTTHYTNTRLSSSTTPYANSKLALMTFAQSFQKHLSSYNRPDKQPHNTRVILVDPGYSRTPGMQRFLTFGSLWGLLLYIILYPLWWLIIKSADQGAQTFLYAAMEEKFSKGEGGWLVKECKEVRLMRPEVADEYVQKELWAHTEQVITEAEKRSAEERTRAKKVADMTEKAEQERAAATGQQTPSEKDAGGKKSTSRRSKKAG